MRTFGRFIALPLKDQILLIRALFLVAAIRIALYLVPFRLLLRWTRRLPRHGRPTSSADSLARAVGAVARFVPRASCLTQALAAQMLLSRAGHDSRLEIGVRKDPRERFEAHAWVVCGDRVVIGGDEAKGFRLIGSWPANT
jgi:Transglutaminase-like superfamily